MTGEIKKVNVLFTDVYQKYIQEIIFRIKSVIWLHMTLFFDNFERRSRAKRWPHSVGSHIIRTSKILLKINKEKSIQKEE